LACFRLSTWRYFGKTSLLLPPLETAASSTISFRKAGNEQLLDGCKTAFLCSRKTSARQRRAIRTWVESLSPDTDCLLCGNHSPMERAVFEQLLRRKIPTILLLAETFPPVWSADIADALDAGLLLVITHCDDAVHFVTYRSAADRNYLMLSLADRIIVGSCTPGGNLSRQLASFRNVTILTPAPRYASFASTPRPASFASTPRSAWLAPFLTLFRRLRKVLFRRRK
jgi:hypothetical protein